MTKVTRQEIKYTITRQDFLCIQPRLAVVLALDQHAQSDGYSVKSLYFDSANDHDFYDALYGRYEKGKIRLRMYNNNQNVINLEYKYKLGSDSKKYTLPLTKGEAELLIAGDYDFLLKVENPIAKNIYVRMVLGAYSPRVIVQYHRIAYKHALNRIRVTFDTAVSASYQISDFWNISMGMLAPVQPLDQGVLEVKYDYFLFTSIKDVLAHIDKQQVANSKYVQSRLMLR